MIIQFKQPVNQAVLQEILRKLKDAHYHGILVKNHLVIFDVAHLELTPREQAAIAEVITEQPRYVLGSRVFHPEDTIIQTAHNRIGGQQFTVMAGPCSVENQAMITDLAAKVKAAGATVIRGGAYKPRTSPYDFQGLGETGLRYLRAAADQQGLDVITEVMSIDEIAVAAPYTDIFQIGARNMQNFDLLKSVGKAGKPVALKRGLAATIDEMLNAAEYIAAQGNLQIMLVERGIRSFDSTYTRNVLDVGGIAVLRKLSHYPVIVDPSHASGHADLVAPLAKAGVAAGAQGMLVEVHQDPAKALSDAAQQLTPAQFAPLVQQVQQIHALLQQPLTSDPQTPAASAAQSAATAAAVDHD